MVLIAFLVAGAVLALTGLSQRNRSNDDAVTAPGTVLELRGSVVARASEVGSAGLVDELNFLVGSIPNAEPFDLGQGRMVVRYSDPNQLHLFINDDVVVSPVGNADGDYLLEAGETYQVTLRRLVANLEPNLHGGEHFKVEIIPIQGPVLSIERTIPSTLAFFNDLG